MKIEGLTNRNTLFGFFPWDKIALIIFKVNFEYQKHQLAEKRFGQISRCPQLLQMMVQRQTVSGHHRISWLWDAGSVQLQLLWAPTPGHHQRQSTAQEGNCKFLTLRLNSPKFINGISLTITGCFYLSGYSILSKQTNNDPHPLQKTQCLLFQGKPQNILRAITLAMWK